ncbi:MAG TPA: MEDS domain-containing protein [Terriglobia bacterium]|nr:MEDS domain-containing protein [Terriglobia bacterium]
MGAGANPIKIPSVSRACQLVVRRQEGPAEFLRFIQEGLEVGQQVVVLAGANCLTNLARAINASGLQSQNLLRGGRLVFLTAPECLEQLKKPEGPVHRATLRRQSPMVRWVSDWSWAYFHGRPTDVQLNYQNRVHDLVRSLEALSLCTVHCSALQRRSLLAVVADHRRAARGNTLTPSSTQFPNAATPLYPVS